MTRDRINIVRETIVAAFMADDHQTYTKAVLEMEELIGVEPGRVHSMDRSSVRRTIAAMGNMELDLVVRRDGKEIATFDVTGKVTISSIHEPDAKAAVRLALGRAYRSIETEWCKDGEWTV